MEPNDDLKTYIRLHDDGSLEAVSATATDAAEQGLLPLVKLPPPDGPCEPYLELAADGQTVERRWGAREATPTELRHAARHALRDQWASLPAWIRGPYHAAFVSAGQLLDSGDDDAAEALIRLAPPMPGFSLDQLNEFGELREQLADAIAALPAI